MSDFSGILQGMFKYTTPFWPFFGMASPVFSDLFLRCCCFQVPCLKQSDINRLHICHNWSTWTFVQLTVFYFDKVHLWQYCHLHHFTRIYQQLVHRRRPPARSMHYICFFLCFFFSPKISFPMNLTSIYNLHTVRICMHYLKSIKTDISTDVTLFT